MNIKQIFLPLFGALALIGCNNEALEPTTQANSVTLELSLEGTAVSTNAMRAVSFNTGEDIPPTMHETGVSNWQTHCFLRNEAGTAQAYSLIDWDATVEGGKIKLKMKGHTLTLEQSGSQPLVQPKDGERWYISGITGGGTLNGDKTRVEFKPDAALDQTLNPNQVRVPFTFGWTGFTVSRVTGQTAPKISVQFEPQGTLLNIRVNNKKNRGGHAVSTSLQVLTNALSNDGYFDYSLTNADPVWQFTKGAAQEEVISRPVSVAKDAATHYVLWGMPRPESAKPSEGFKSEVYLGRYKIFSEMTKTKPAIRTKGFASGLAYPMGIDIDRPFMPLEYVAARNLAPESEWSTPQSPKFASSNENDASGYFDWNESIAKFSSPMVIDGMGYHLPNVQELQGMFVGRVPNARHFSGPYYLTTRGNDYDETIMLEGEVVQGKADYYSSGDYILYAVRLKDDSNNNMNTIVCRYSFTSHAPGSLTAHLEVISRWVGSSLGDVDQLIQKIQEPDFWTTNTEDDVKVIFPATGYYRGSKSTNPLYHLGQSGRYWSINTSLEYPGLSDHANFGDSNVNGFNINSRSWCYSIRLFKDRIR